MTSWLIDKSALVRLDRSRTPEQWEDRLERGLLSICTVTRLEVGYSARSSADLRALFAHPPVSELLISYSTPAIEERALEVQRFLADRGQHRAPSLADLLIAATAELTRMTLLHYDKDFDLIAEVTGQPVEWLEIAG